MVRQPGDRGADAPAARQPGAQNHRSHVTRQGLSRVPAELPHRSARPIVEWPPLREDDAGQRRRRLRGGGQLASEVGQKEGEVVVGHIVSNVEATPITPLLAGILDGDVVTGQGEAVVL